MMQTLTQKYKLWLTIPLLFFGTGLIKAQSWQDLLQLGNENIQTITTIAQASENLIFAGAFTESLDIGNATLTSLGEEDIFVAQRDQDGQLAIILSGGSLRADAIDALAIDTNGDLLIAGSFWETIDFGTFQLTSDADSPKALFLIKINPAGQLIWSQVFTGGSIKDIYDLSLSNRNDVLIGGYYGSELRFADTLLQSAARSTAFYAKFQANGQLQWANSIGETGNNRITTTTVFEDQYFYLGGYYDDTLKVFGQTFPANTNDADAFILSVDQDGNFRWVQKAGGVFEENPTTMIHDETGNIYMGGRLIGVLLVNDSLSIQSRDGNADCFLIKYDSLGNAVWAQSFGGDQLQLLNDLAYQDGYLWLTGSFQENLQIGSLQINATNAFDAYLAQLDTAGNSMQLITLPSTTGSVLPNHLSFDAAGVLVAGDFSGVLDLVNTQLDAGFTNFNSFIVRWNELVSSVHTNFPIEKVFLTPNPTGDFFSIEGLDEVDLLWVVDSQGKVVFPPQKVTGPINCSQWANGLYYLNIRSKNNQKTVLLVKNR